MVLFCWFQNSWHMTKKVCCKIAWRESLLDQEADSVALPRLSRVKGDPASQSDDPPTDFLACRLSWHTDVGYYSYTDSYEQESLL